MDGICKVMLILFAKLVYINRICDRKSDVTYQLSNHRIIICGKIKIFISLQNIKYFELNRVPQLIQNSFKIIDFMEASFCSKKKNSYSLVRLFKKHKFNTFQ